MLSFINQMEKKDIIFFSCLFLGIGVGITLDVLLNKYDNIDQVILAIIFLSSSIPFWDELGRRNIYRL